MPRKGTLVALASMFCIAVAGCRWPKKRPLSLNEQRISAMVSVHLHAAYAKSEIPKQLRVMPLVDAARFIHEDITRDFFGQARRHRAIAKLAAYGPVEFRDALRILIEDEPLARLLARIEGESAAQKEMSANDTLITLIGSPFPGCTPSTLTYDVDATNPMTISATVSVHRSSLGDIERALDPQNWDLCSKFWTPPERAFLATRSGTTVTPVSPKPSYAPYVSDLYEHFHAVVCESTLFFLPPTCHDADFENMLHITSTPQSNGYRADYEFLAPPIHGVIDSLDVTIEKDDGHVAATAGTAPNTWTAEGKKTLKFKEDIGDEWARIAFGAALQELAAEVSDIACCDVSVLAQGPPPQSTGVNPIR